MVSQTGVDHHGHLRKWRNIFIRPPPKKKQKKKHKNKKRDAGLHGAIGRRRLDGVPHALGCLVVRVLGVTHLADGRSLGSGAPELRLVVMLCFFLTSALKIDVYTYIYIDICININIYIYMYHV